MASDKYKLNIRTGTIHSNNHICHRGQKIKKGYSKTFNDYQEAVDYYEGSSMRGRLCALCFPERTIGAS